MSRVRDSGGILSEKHIGRLLRRRDAGGLVRERDAGGVGMLEGCLE